MKKILTVFLFVVSFASLALADYNSGWKYITSIAYNYNAGNLSSVEIFGATTPSGTASTIATINNTNILGQTALKNILVNLETAKEDAQKTHITIYQTGTGYSITSGANCRIDHEDN